nr:MAG TPA: hypothetical protein [Caudoviricetes sp.]
MLYCRMFVEWFSQKMVGPLFIFSFDSSTAEQAEQRKNQRSDPKPTMAPYCTHNHDDNDAFHPSRSDSGTKHHKAVTHAENPQDHTPIRKRQSHILQPMQSTACGLLALRNAHRLRGDEEHH